MRRLAGDRKITRLTPCESRVLADQGFALRSGLAEIVWSAFDKMNYCPRNQFHHQKGMTMKNPIKALRIAEKLTDQFKKASVFHGMAEVYYSLDKLDKALENTQKGVTIIEEIANVRQLSMSEKKEFLEGYANVCFNPSFLDPTNGSINFIPLRCSLA